jgi:hypothetical protein
MASNWFTMCAARWLDSAIWCSERFSWPRVASPASISRCGQLGLHAQPGQGRLQLVRGVGQEVLLRWRWTGPARCSRSLMARTSGATSSGASRVVDRAEVGAVALADALLQIGSAGEMPRASASHTSSTASGRMTNCGRITPLMISAARRERLPSVLGHLHQHRAPCAAGSGGGHSEAAPHRLVARCTSSREAEFAGLAAAGVGRRAARRSPASSSPARAQHLEVDLSRVVTAAAGCRPAAGRRCTRQRGRGLRQLESAALGEHAVTGQFRS